MHVDGVLFSYLLNPTPLYWHKTELSTLGIIRGMHCIWKTEIVYLNNDTFLLVGWPSLRTPGPHSSSEALAMRHVSLQNEQLWMSPVACTLWSFYNSFTLYLYCSWNSITSFNADSQRRRKAKRGNGSITFFFLCVSFSSVPPSLFHPPPVNKV